MCYPWKYFIFWITYLFFLVQQISFQSIFQNVSLCQFANWHSLAMCGYQSAHLHLIAFALFYSIFCTKQILLASCKWAWHAITLWYTLRRHYEMLQIRPDFSPASNSPLPLVLFAFTSWDPFELSTEVCGNAFDMKMKQGDWIFSQARWKNLFITPPDFFHLSTFFFFFLKFRVCCLSSEYVFPDPSCVILFNQSYLLFSRSGVCIVLICKDYFHN